MKSPFDIIISPVVTEKSMADMAENKYTFRVDAKCNKAEIRHAVEEAFDGVKVKRVNTITMKGKTKRVRWSPRDARIDLRGDHKIYTGEVVDGKP